MGNDLPVPDDRTHATPLKGRGIATRLAHRFETTQRSVQSVEPWDAPSTGMQTRSFGSRPAASSLATIPPTFLSPGRSIHPRGCEHQADFAHRMKGQGLWADLIHQRVDKARSRYGMTGTGPVLSMDAFVPPMPSEDLQGRLFWLSRSPCRPHVGGQRR
jgi:hypothetical protein